MYWFYIPEFLHSAGKNAKQPTPIHSDGSCLWRDLACHARPHCKVLSRMFLKSHRWVPPAARSSFISQTYMGGMIGIVLSFPLCGLIITNFGDQGCMYL